MKPVFTLRSLGVAGLALLSVPLAAFAQGLPISTVPLSLSFSPANPHPGGTVLVTPQSTVVSIANSTMVATVNGAQVYSGNAGPFTAQLAPVGKSTVIKVTIKSNGVSYSKTLSLSPGEVSLVAEPLSTAPALYQGKPRVPNGGSVRIVAVADFRTSATLRLDPAILSYSWSVNDTMLPNASGIGKNVLVLTSPLQYRNEDVSVTVSSPGGSITGGDTLSLVPQNPTIRIYREDPLSGILYDHTVENTFTIASAESTLIAEPFSFALSAGIPAINWFLNGTAAQSGPEITLRPNGTGGGSASLSVSVSQPSAYQTTSANLSIIFGNSSNFFGL